MRIPWKERVRLFAFCNDCAMEWGPAGRFLYLYYLTADRIFALPIPSGRVLPPLPEEGLPTHGATAGFPDAEVLDIVEEWETAIQFAPGADPSTYVSFRTAVHRNLFRVPIPH